MSVEAHHIKEVGELSGVNTRIGWDASISSSEWWQYYTCSSPIIDREDDLSSTTRAGRLTALSGLFKDTLSDWFITRNRRKPGEVRFIEGFVHGRRITVFYLVPYCGMVWKVYLWDYLEKGLSCLDENNGWYGWYLYLFVPTSMRWKYGWKSK